jgi:Cu-Zn family superoxide dismutase
MGPTRLGGAAIVVTTLMMIQSCGRETAEKATSGAASPRTGAFAEVTAGVAMLYPTADYEISGTVTLREVGDSLRVTTDVVGLPPDSEFGFHVHEWGDITAPDGLSAGAHYNPQGHPHALPPATPRHAGDLPNLRSNATGEARMTFTVAGLSIAGETNPVLGRAIVVHEWPDDGNPPSGSPAARLACGVIGVAPPQGAVRPGSRADSTAAAARDTTP